MIIRAPRPTGHFTQVRNDLCRDPRLSFKARGLLVYLLSFPDFWRFRVEELVKAGPDGRHAVTTGMKELEQAGYLIRKRQRHPDGTFSTQLLVFDTNDPSERTVPSPAGDDLWETPTTTADYPSRITGQSLEHCEMKNVHGVMPRTSRGATPRLCMKCRGSGRLVVNEEPAQCHDCGGAGIK